MGGVEERDAEGTFFLMVLFLFFKTFFSFGWVCKCVGGGWWGHRELCDIPVMLVVTASLLQMNTCSICAVNKCNVIS